MKNSYWYAHNRMGSKAQAFYGNIFDLPEELGTFDVVVIGQILVHIRDPLGALIECASHSHDRVVIAEGMVDTEEPMGRFLPRPDGTSHAWWHLSIGAYTNMLAVLGFDLEAKSDALYRNNTRDKETKITTLVFRRQ